ncbi:vWA domain-containing protein [Aliterella atlantica]|uniref:VWFA domain-containing protein n=1 Tax=Aliterella atlantica CENA595 TaxID=1618023 RepID=A0A0D8ZQX5_9CYAN|nr:VWA domain-containing protein [Aliterella atlantica]KJH69626.1 hypothetical protein UH38_22605 [Aliterella atlantica CENA595]
MSNLTNPLEAILVQAAQLPESGALKKVSKRIDASGENSAILLDVSSSMNELVHGGERKIDVLRSVFHLRTKAANEIAIAFSSIAAIIPDFAFIPHPNGNTDLEQAIFLAATYKPRATLVISDGMPDCETKALNVAKRLTGVINCLFVGNEEDLSAIAFMNKLARLGCGTATVCDISKLDGEPKLNSAIALLLPPAS